METFGGRFRAWREAHGVSGWKIEKETGIPRTTISNVEHGRRTASDDVLQKIATIPEMGITIEQLKAWQVIDQFGLEVLAQAFKELADHNPEMAALTREAYKRAGKEIKN